MHLSRREFLFGTTAAVLAPMGVEEPEIHHSVVDAPPWERARFLCIKTGNGREIRSRIIVGHSKVEVAQMSMGLIHRNGDRDHCLRVLKLWAEQLGREPGLV